MWSSLGSRARVTWGLVLLSLLLQFPFLNRGISLHDEGSILTIADGLRNGEVLYLDRVTPLGPLTYELMAFLMKALGPSFLVGRVFQMLVLTGCIVLVHSILLRVVGPRAAVLGAISVLALKPLAFPLWTMVNYSQIAMLLCLASILILMRYLSRPGASWLLAVGVGVGLTLLTKQNLGVVLAGAIAVTLVLDGWNDAERRLHPLAARLGLLLLGTVAPVAVVFFLYLTAGAGGDFIHRAVLGLVYLAPAYLVPLPGLEPWAVGPQGAGQQAFTYFPAPLFNLGWQGASWVFSGATALLIEYLVKIAYYLPIAAFILGAYSVVRTRGSRIPRATWSALVLITVFGAGAYSSMLYRADWAHVMNVYPALIVLCVTVLARSAERYSFPWWAGIVLCAIWLGAGLATTAAVLAVYRTPVDMPRGRMLGAPSRARETARVLAYLDQQRDDERILILRGEPLYYFLSGRRVPLAFDLLMPGVITPADDASVADRLASIDQVIYNPQETPLVPSPIVDYAPRTAAVLAGDFRVDRMVSKTALILKRRREVALPETVEVDLWDRFYELQLPSERIVRESWIMYRVIVVQLEAEGARTCFSLSHRVGRGEAISVTPLSHPDTWSARAQGISMSDVMFEISIREKSPIKKAMGVEERILGEPGVPIRVPLDAFVGRSIEIRFCAGPSHGDRAVPTPERVGWAEPSIVRGARLD